MKKLNLLGLIWDSQCQNVAVHKSTLQGGCVPLSGLIIFRAIWNLSGCAITESSSVSETKVADASVPKIICKREKITGVDGKQKDCKTKAQIERERQQAKEMLRRANIGSAQRPERPQWSTPHHEAAPREK